MLSTSGLQNKHPECADLETICSPAVCRGCGCGVVVVAVVLGQGQGDGVVGDMASLQSSSALEIWLCRIIIFGCV